VWKWVRKRKDTEDLIIEGLRWINLRVWVTGGKVGRKIKSKEYRNYSN
jgi:hypothetical protein